MKTLVKLKLASGEELLAEVDEIEAGIGTTRVARAGELVEIPQAKLEAALKPMKATAELLIDSLKGLCSPDQIELSFGIKLSASTSVILAGATTEANFNVKLAWKHSDGKTQSRASS